MRKRITVILISLLLNGTIQLTADTVIDTIYAIGPLTGTLIFSQANQCIVFNDYTLNIGDTGEALVTPPPSDPNSIERGFISFELPDVPEGYVLDSAYIRLYQVKSYGNSIYQFPVWNVVGGDTMYCIMDHIDYGDELDVSDWTKGDPGDTGTLHTNIGIISDIGEDGYRFLDITDYVLYDYNNIKDKTQYRIRFPIETDWDYLGDLTNFSTSNSAVVNHRPLIFIYCTSNASIGDNIIPEVFNISLYPNPVKGILSCKLHVHKQGNFNISLFNVKGQLEKTIRETFFSQGNYMFSLDMKDFCSGIYFLTLRNNDNDFKLTKKIIKLD